MAEQGRGGGVIAAPFVLPPLANAVGYGIGWAQGAFGTGGGVLLGKWISEEENYIIDANELGLNYFNVGKAYKILNYLGDGWTPDRAFLDASIARGQNFLLNQAPFSEFTTGSYSQEIRYLFDAGVQNGKIMIRVFY